MAPHRNVAAGAAEEPGAGARPVAVAAIDLGASSGRVILGVVGQGRLDLTEVGRFPNRPVRLAGRLYWDLPGLFAGIVDGLRAAELRAAQQGLELASIGVDTWAVDYGLLAADGSLLGLPVHYRDARNDGIAARAAAEWGPDDLFRRTGIAEQPFNTRYQVMADREDGVGRLDIAHRMLMIPDLIAFWLTGRQVGEVTNASTTGLLDPISRTWDESLARGFGVDARLLPHLLEPGDPIGPISDDIARDLGWDRLRPMVTAVGTHDTASAMLAVPAAPGPYACIASGTWSLLGTELTAPIVSPQARAAGFTNEAGVDGTVRFLRNVMGLWLLQESLRGWRLQGLNLALADLLTQAAALPAGGPVIDPDLPLFLPPGDMPARIAEECRRTGQRSPHDPAAVVRCVLDSLADAYRRALADMARLTGETPEVLHIVGGGSQNSLLCRLTADACDLPVVAGPTEGSALGNILVQARAAGVVPGSRWQLRDLVARTHELRRYVPGPKSRRP